MVFAGLGAIAASSVLLHRWQRKAKEARLRTVKRLLNECKLGRISLTQLETEMGKLKLSQEEILEILLWLDQPGIPICWYGIPDDLLNALRCRKE